jgi:hypothetical protein
VLTVAAGVGVAYGLGLALIVCGGLTLAVCPILLWLMLLAAAAPDEPDDDQGKPQTVPQERY